MLLVECLSIIQRPFPTFSYCLYRKSFHRVCYNLDTQIMIWLNLHALNFEFSGKKLYNNNNNNNNNIYIIIIIIIIINLEIQFLRTFRNRSSNGRC